MTITVTGSTGSIGSELVRLLAESRTSVRAVLRNTARATPLAGVEWHQADLADASKLDAALEGTTRLFLLTGIDPGFGEVQSSVIRAAERLGVKHVVKLSALGASAESRSPLAREHWEAEQTLERSGMEWTILRPHAFMQNWLAGVAPTVRAAKAIYSAVGDGRVPFIDARDVAAVSAEVLRDPEPHVRKKYVLTGGEAIGYADLADALTETLGTTVTYYPLTPEQEGERLRKIGIPDDIVESLLALAAYQKAGGPTARVTDSVEQILGRAPRTVREFVRDYRAAFMA